ncbi:EscU/YscU/HrcU family type III secretion system export apparatus switch protein [Chromobacterium phragmitis]|uniref:EscU/YscU/HrcU family type III secretion system export apparatus switch protein n=1 Tax=Chromobacterium phragmitis TaxID=2202141 RepID=UPI000DECA02D|nr:EscU/YscU/HrcU family type III secretion system export apparatus switch protein [Chromobacterium phragmitis]AXE30560.1 EscU/YscU/HrcU family type III secretion system export apparatus switch protein [Chromobacterium phragmitis]
MSEKTEQPTAKRIRDAREEGQVAKSQEINALVQLGVLLLWLAAEGPALYQGFGAALTLAAGDINLPLVDALQRSLELLAWLALRFVVGMAGMVALALTLTGLLQSGFLFAPKALHPSGERINPLSNIKQIFSMRNLFEFAKMLLKVGVLGLTFAYLIKRYAFSFAHLQQAGLAAGFAVCVQMGQWMWMILLAATAVFSVADYAMQHHQLRKQLMMSREDIKQEFKNAEGSPEIKHKRRELHREVQSGSLAGKVAQSSVVVRNPRHLAVCLRYQAGETPLPQVLAQGRDAMALHIVALAEARGVPVVENVPLARALVAATQPGDYIPQPLFRAVAQLLAMLREQAEAEGDGDG